jgi:hypothetical protein
MTSWTGVLQRFSIYGPLRTSKSLLGTRRRVSQIAQAGDGLASRLNRVPGGLRTRIA